MSRPERLALRYCNGCGYGTVETPWKPPLRHAPSCGALAADIEELVVVPASHLEQALAALNDIASRPTTERNPDGDEQAAHSMQLIARDTLASYRAAGGGNVSDERKHDWTLLGGGHGMEVWGCKRCQRTTIPSVFGFLWPDLGRLIWPGKWGCRG